jgi:hypothetical protein
MIASWHNRTTQPSGFGRLATEPMSGEFTLSTPFQALASVSYVVSKFTIRLSLAFV